MGRQGLYQEPTPTAVCLIPAIIVNAMLDGDAVSVDTLMAIPCHVMQGKISRRAKVAGFRFSIYATAVCAIYAIAVYAAYALAVCAIYAIAVYAVYAIYAMTGSLKSQVEPVLPNIQRGSGRDFNREKCLTLILSAD